MHSVGQQGAALTHQHPAASLCRNLLELVKLGNNGSSERVLTNLLSFHSSCVLAAEAQLGDGDIIKNDVEIFGPFKQLPAHQQRHLNMNSDASALTTLTEQRAKVLQYLSPLCDEL